MPSSERHIICCSAPYGSGGLGQHFTQVLEDTRASCNLVRYFSSSIRAGDESVGVAVSERLATAVCRVPPVRFSPGWRNHLMGVAFDRKVSRLLRDKADVITCFGGQALHTFRQARRIGCTRLHLQAANSHLHNVRRLHQQACKRSPIEASWLNDAQIRKTLREYSIAEVIHVASEYTRQSFLAAGFPEERLHRIRLRVHPRFDKASRLPADGVFRVVYTGSLTVAKGIPLLVEAFSRLAIKSAELILIGGWATRGMRRYIQQKMRVDSRIRIAPGDPLPHLCRASVYVHPSWEDGWAYAAAEAVACGVPTIVTEDTGMKELIVEGVNGYVVPTGSVDAIYERLKGMTQC